MNLILSQDADYLATAEHLWEKRFDEARECYTKCMRKTDSSLQKSLMLCLIAKTYSQQDLTEMASRFFRDAELIDRSGTSCFMHSQFLFDIGDNAAAIRKCMKAIQLAKKDKESTMEDSQFAISLYEESILEYRKKNRKKK